jgi:hypothetical protein
MSEYVVIIVDDEKLPDQRFCNGTGYWACSFKQKQCVECPKDCPVAKIYKKGQQSLISQAKPIREFIRIVLQASKAWEDGANKDVSNYEFITSQFIQEGKE